MLAKSKLNGVGILISMASINSFTSHDEFALINNLLKEYEKMKEEIKELNVLGT